MLVAAILALTLLALPASAGAVLPGKNGEVLFTSGRGGAPNDDSLAQIWVVPFAGGTATQLTQNGAIQHRHSTWSPDYTKFAYAAGPVNQWDIYVRDLTKPLSATNPTNITNNPATPHDRPSWSPDGTRIAYTMVVGGIKDVYVQNVATGAVTKLSAALMDQDADKPAWSPDSQTIFYSFDMNSGSGAVNVDGDILKEPAGNTNGVGATGVVTGSGTDDYQPAVSPDGQSLCYTSGRFGTTMANVYRSTITGGNITLIANSGNGDYNCVWSPDGTKIAYVTGIFTSGALVMKNSDGSDVVSSPGAPVADDVPNHFDGNPDWARNGAPTCQPANVILEKNTPTTISLSCADPPPENGATTKSITSAPPNGTLGGLQQGQPANVLYTPKTDFTGHDTFSFKGNDGVSDSAAATVELTVKDTKPATVSSFSAGNSRWRLGSLLPAFFSRKLAPVGTTFSFRLDEAAKVTLTFALKTTGRTVNKVCKALKRSNRNKPKCTRYLNKGSISKSVKAGKTKVRFQGRITSKKKLGLGTYRLTLDVVDLSGNKSKSKVGYFSIVRFR
jgi:dipeptidyl aminopeptidase/acylaminoacyl peptidase